MARYGDPKDQAAEKTPARYGAAADAEPVQKEQPSFVGHALSTAASDLNPFNVASGVARTIMHPIETLRGMATPPNPNPIPESQLPQDPVHRFQRFLGGGPNNRPPGMDTPFSEYVGHGLALGAMAAAPPLLRKGTGAVMEHVPQGFNIVHPDVRSSGLKAAIGYAATEPMPGLIKWPVRAVGVWPLARQAARGLMNPDAYAQQAVSELPTIKAPAAGTPPSVFGDPQGFSKLPANVQEAILRGGSAPSAPQPKPEYVPRSPEYYGVRLPEDLPAKPEAPTEITPPPAVNDLLGKLRLKLEQQGMLKPGYHLGEEPHGTYSERWDEGAPTPTVKATTGRTTVLRNPSPGSPLSKNPKALDIAKDLAKEIKKGGK